MYFDKALLNLRDPWRADYFEYGWSTLTIGIERYLYRVREMLCNPSTCGHPYLYRVELPDTVSETPVEGTSDSKGAGARWGQLYEPRP
jgi:hypothetical protein